MREFIFKREMARVFETFGLQNYPRPKVEEIYKVVREVPDEEFQRICSRLIGELPVRTPPGTKEFREYAEHSLKVIRDAQAAASFKNPEPEHRVYRTSDEVMDDVANFFRSIVAIERLPQWFKDGFRDEARKRFPELSDDVERLKDMVQAGSMEARTEYAEKAKRLMTLTAMGVVFHLPTIPNAPNNEKE